jgi:hypothetical protein
VASYLSTSDDIIKDDGFWVLQNANALVGNQDTPNKTSNKSAERGLYFITLSQNVKIPGAGFMFKIGKSDDVKERLKAYSRSLPIDTIQLISYYPIPEPVNLREAELEVNGELKGNENLGDGYFDHKITVRPYLGNHQEEWLQTLDLRFSDEEGLSKLANIIDEIVKTTIETLTPKPTEDDTNE